MIRRPTTPLVAALALLIACGGAEAPDPPLDGTPGAALDASAPPVTDVAEATPDADAAPARAPDPGPDLAEGPDVEGVPDAPPGPDCSEQVFEDLLIPMRDGEHLSAWVRRAVDPACALPTVLLQTPYDKENVRPLWFESDLEQPLFSSPHYHFVVTDWRGYFGSKDAAVLQPNRGEDGYDSVEWIAAQPWSDGQVGTWGVSALCRVQYNTALEQPPHLVAAVPIFCQLDSTYLEFYPGGVLRREWFDFIGAWFGGALALEHPLHDLTWTYVENLLDGSLVSVPMLIVAGWYDLYNRGSFATWEELVAADQAEHRLLVGAWHHFAAGGETASGRPLTAQELLYWDDERRIQRDSLAWFDHHLRGLDNEAASWAPVRFEQGGESTWHEAASWPPPTAPKQLYLQPGGVLGSARDVSGQAVSWIHDPTDPSPTVGGQTLWWELLHGPHDQAPVLARDDAVAFVSAPLDAPLRLQGAVTATLAASTTAADADLAVRLTDVDATGAHLLVGEGIRRLKLRDAYSKVSDVVPGERYDATVTLTNQHAYTFAAGHRVGLVVSGANAPRFDPNAGTGADHYDAEAAPVSAEITVYVDGVSRLVLPVAE